MLRKGFAETAAQCPDTRAASRTASPRLQVIDAETVRHLRRMDVEFEGPRAIRQQLIQQPLVDPDAQGRPAPLCPVRSGCDASCQTWL